MIHGITAATGIMIPGTTIPGITVTGVLASISASHTDGDGVGIVLTIPAGIMDGVIPTMEVTGLVITVVTGTDITGVVDIIHTTIPTQITVMEVAEITLMEEGLQGTGIIRPMNTTAARLVAEEVIILSVRGVQEHQPLPKVLQRVQGHPQPAVQSRIQDAVLQSPAGIPVQAVEIIVHQTERPVREVARPI